MPAGEVGEGGESEFHDASSVARLVARATLGPSGVDGAKSTRACSTVATRRVVEWARRSRCVAPCSACTESRAAGAGAAPPRVSTTVAAPSRTYINHSGPSASPRCDQRRSEAATAWASVSWWARSWARSPGVAGSVASAAAVSAAAARAASAAWTCARGSASNGAAARRRRGGRRRSR